MLTDVDERSAGLIWCTCME